jgi:hypothetical protein
MLGWFTNRSWSLGDVLALGGILATFVVALFGPARRWLLDLIRVGLLRLGRPEARYASWFISKWGVYDNPYLADTEDLDLSSTYVSLSFRATASDPEIRTAANKVLADRRAGNVVIDGAPGSGKSTLLKAYAVGVLKTHRRLLFRSRHEDIPFFVQLRKFARHVNRDAALAQYLVEEILVSGVGMSKAEATNFFITRCLSGVR